MHHKNVNDTGRFFSLFIKLLWCCFSAGHTEVHCIVRTKSTMVSMCWHLSYRTSDVCFVTLVILWLGHHTPAVVTLWVQLLAVCRHITILASRSHKCVYQQATQFVTSQRMVMSCGWERNLALHSPHSPHITDLVIYLPLNSMVYDRDMIIKLSKYDRHDRDILDIFPGRSWFPRCIKWKQNDTVTEISYTSGQFTFCSVSMNAGESAIFWK